MSEEFTLTIRLFDPLEKKNPAQSACWAVIKVPREDANLPTDEFIAKHIKPHLIYLKQLKLS
jgi:hypothetical protein